MFIKLTEYSTEKMYVVHRDHIIWMNETAGHTWLRLSDSRSLGVNERMDAILGAFDVTFVEIDGTEPARDA